MNICITLFLVTIFLSKGCSITTETDAIQSRQLWGQARPTRYPQNRPQDIPNFGLSQSPNVQAFMEALDSIATHDELRCVAKLLCEATTGTVLPFNIDLGSFIEFLSNFEGPRPSPIILYGKAAALGYTSKGNSASCTYAYPRCPSNPDVLIEYLNNHRGGFFRFFGGIRKPQNFNQFASSNAYAEKRILNRPNSLFEADEGFVKSDVRFPVESEQLGFPPNSHQDFYDYIEKDQNYRRQKSLAFPESDNNNYYGGVVNFQRPLPNHKASAMIFPDRTGTGELIVDTEKFEF